MGRIGKNRKDRFETEEGEMNGGKYGGGKGFKRGCRASKRE